MASERNRQTVLKFIAHQQDSKGRVNDDLVTEDLQWWIAGFGIYERKAYAEMIDTIRPRLSKWYAFTPVNTVAEGDQVTVEMTGTATMTSGKSYANDYCIIFKFRDGRIFSIREYYDTKTAHEFYSDILG